MRIATCLVLALALPACSGKPAPSDDVTALAGADAKSDAFSARLKLLGDPTDGASVKYTRTPTFRGWAFDAAPNTDLDVWVRSKSGDAVAWLLDSKFKIVAKNDDADASTYDAHISQKLAVGDRYYIVFRDYGYETHFFTLGYRALRQKPIVATPPQPPGGALRTRFLSEFKPATWTAHAAVDVATTPAAMHARVAQFRSFVGLPTALWKLTGGFALVCAGEDNRWFVDLYDTAGRWIDHGHDDYQAGSNLLWSFDDNDPSICSCSLQASGGLCIWIDGSLSGSGSVECD